MSKQKMRDNEEIIIAMREAGKSRQEIADELNLTKEQIKNWVTRYNRKVEKQGKGIPALPRDILAEQAYEIHRLKMENELLRDFLSLTGKE